MYIAPVDIESITTFNPCLNAVMTTYTGKEPEMCIQKCNFGLWQHPGGKKNVSIMHPLTCALMHNWC